MLLRTLLFVLAISASNTVFAQLPDGSTAPDFMITDLNGEQYQLYPYLESGKSVILDFSATWCGICWNYHNSHAIEDAYVAYGPSGMDIARAFYIEADANTNDACVTGSMGCSTSTIGDWTAGTSYPIINLTGDELSVKSDYNISGYPTIIAIAPNKKMYETGKINSSVWTSWLTETLALEVSATINDDMIDLTTTGGFGVITFEWNNGETTEDISGLAAGTYSVTITEGRGHSIELIDLLIEADSNLTIACPSDMTAVCSVDELSPYTSLTSFEEAGGIVGGDFNPNSFLFISELTDGTCPEILTRRYSIADMNGATMECSQQIVIYDDISPIIVSPSDMTLSEIPLAYATLDQYLAHGGAISDNCEIDTNSFALLSEITDNITPCATLDRVYMIADLCGNTATAEQSMLVGLSSDASVVYTFSNSGLAYDFVFGANFGTDFEWTVDGVIISTDENPSFLFDAPGTYVVCLTVNSDCGSLTSCQDINATIDGVFVNFSCPAQVNNLCSIDELPVFTSLTEWQEGGGFVNGDYDPNSFELIDESSDTESCPETIFRTYRILDINGQIYGCQHIITVNDEEGPIMVSPSSTIVADLSDQVYFSIENFISAGGELSDNCELDEYGFSIFTQFSDEEDPCATLLRVYLASDICGNTTTSEQVVYVELSDNAQLSFTNIISELEVDFTLESNFGNSFEWTFGDGNISTEENPSHSYSEEGTYEVCVTVNSPCGSLTFCEDINIIIINSKEYEGNSKLIEVFPNPISGIANIEIDASVTINKIEVISIEGRLMDVSFNMNNIQSIQMNQLNAGLYLLRVQSGSEFIYKKIMVQ